jgi:uncharacterized metal-binding protein
MIYACSGAADVGEIADRAARAIMCQGGGKLSCLAGIACRKPGLMASAEAADAILVIDGCPLNCGSKVAEEAGLAFRHLRLYDIGMRKGAAPPTDQRIAEAVSRGLSLLDEPLAA